MTLINLPIVHRRNDPFGNIPFMPTGITYLAGFLKQNNIDIFIIDGFGLAPTRKYRIDNKLSAIGLTEDEIVKQLKHPDLIGISIHSGMSHSFSLRLAKKIKSLYPKTGLVAGGSHASVVYRELLEHNFDYVVIGEGEHTLLALIRFIRDGEGHLKEIPGLAYSNKVNLPCILEENLDKFGFAFFNCLPLENYWNLGMSHAPIKGKYLAITTSRGCPYNCNFCATPILLGRKWRFRSPKVIVDEIEKAVKDSQVYDFIIQDEIFGYKKGYIEDFAREILKRHLNIRCYLPSGVKVENLDEKNIFLLKKIGLQYICFAPESGSEALLKKMNKPFNYEKFFYLTSLSLKLGIKIGCFYIIGYPGENDGDRKKTKQMITRLAKMGVDEISLFIWTPLPGARAFELESGWECYEDLNWSPDWRRDYNIYSEYRRNLYINWFLKKLRHHPIKMMSSLWNIFTGNFELKSEMAARRVINSFFFIKSFKGKFLKK